MGSLNGKKKKAPAARVLNKKRAIRVRETIVKKKSIEDDKKMKPKSKRDSSGKFVKK